MKNKKVFIGATGQNVGKTTVCLGILSGLLKRHQHVSFIKPVGQRHTTLHDGKLADKDVVLFKDHFRLKHTYQDMSPVLFPSGTTVKYLDGKVEQKKLENALLHSFKTISENADFTLIEGTGHIGVGSLFNLNNAKVAKMLEADMIIVVQAGIGSTFDELALNKQMCDAYGVKVKGAIINRLILEKKDKITTYIKKALKRWDIPLIGSIPYDRFLSKPSMQDFVTLFNEPLLSGEMYKYRRFMHTRLGVLTIDYFKEVPSLQNELVIIPTTRDGIINEVIDRHKIKKGLDGGMILTGTPPPSKIIINKLNELKIPSMYVPDTTYKVMKKINSFISKTGADDISKIQRAIELVESNINFDLI